MNIQVSPIDIMVPMKIQISSFDTMVPMKIQVSLISAMVTMKTGLSVHFLNQPTQPPRPRLKAWNNSTQGIALVLTNI
ncbi:MAG: hypothetical protein ACOZDD_18025 [Bacteroidota bacterium]